MDQVFILNEIKALRKEAGLPTLLTFVDVTRAYDRVWKPGLWWKLKQAGIGGDCLRLLRCMLSKVCRSVRIQDYGSDTFEVEAGVAQGSVLSPLLYALFIDGLHDVFKDLGLGVEVYGRQVPLLLYADDVVFLATDAAEMRKMIAVLEVYAKTWRFNIKSKKCGILVCGSAKLRREMDSYVWSIGGGRVDVVDSYKYLGVDVGGREAGKWNVLLERLIGKAQKQVNALIWRGMGSNGLLPRTYKQLFESQVRPIVEYGAELWEGEISATLVAKLETLQYNFAKLVLGCKNSKPV